MFNRIYRVYNLSGVPSGAFPVGVRLSGSATSAVYHAWRISGRLRRGARMRREWVRLGWCQLGCDIFVVRLWWLLFQNSMEWLGGLAPEMLGANAGTRT